jgi:ferrous iron transport protein B
MDTKTYNPNEEIISNATRLRQEIGENFYDTVLESIYTEAEAIAGRAVRHREDKPKYTLDRTIDKIVTSRIFGFPIMVALLAIVFWITIEGSNIPSNFLYFLLVDTLHPALKSMAASIGTPWWLYGLLVDGAYLSVAWVVSVMLPPMAIFFPLFTLLEDFGYLPRVAFNMDSLFRKAGAHGKQALTMSMGFGCNAAGIIATRIIDSPRERIIAILTNNFSLCNGRWPTQILIATIFIGSLVPAHLAGLVSATAVVSIAILGIVLSIVLSWVLSHTILKGESSTFSLELPPYRPPRILRTLYTSLIDRTIFVLWRAILFALPAGLVIWLVSNITFGEASIAEHFIGWANPSGIFIGLNGIILLAYIIAIPANEIVIPTILMLTVTTLGMHELGAGTGVMFEFDSVNVTASVFQAGGWTLLTAVNLMLFSLIHNPCSTTLYTIYKETGSMKWTTMAAVIPLGMGIAVCFFVAQIWRLFTGG